MDRCVEWWERKVDLQFLEDVAVIGSIPSEIRSAYNLARNHLFSSLQSSFHSRLRALDGQDRGNFPVILHPVYIDFQPSWFAALVRLHNEGDFRNWCRQNLLESDIPFIFKYRKLSGYRSLNPSFFNVVFLQSSAFPLMEFSSDQRVWFFQSLFAKLGSFKNLIVLCGQSGIDRVYLSSLEGGHPSFTSDQFDELARRLHVFGSAKPAQIDFASSNLTIPSDIWVNSAGVKQLRALGQFAGEYDLLSPPVRIVDLVNNHSLCRFIERLAHYSQQAEGAMCVVDPGLSNALKTCNPIVLVTASGQFGAVKTDLGVEDIIAIEIDIASRCLRRVRVVESDGKKPSVEAHEFLAPLVDLCLRYPLFVAPLLHGSGFQPVNSLLLPDAVRVPPIRGIFHIHRRLITDTSSFYPQIINENPPVGCGVDLMHTISSKNLKAGVGRWHFEHRSIPRIIFEVANHGVNIVEFWALNNGVYSATCYADFQEAVRHRRLVFDRCIEQK